MPGLVLCPNNPTGQDYWWSDLLNRAWGVHLPINKGIIAIIISLVVQISCLFIPNGTPYFL
jgi:hypothetical protein